MKLWNLHVMKHGYVERDSTLKSVFARLAPSPSADLLLFSTLQFHSGQPDESGHHAFRREPRRSHHPPQPLPQLPPASSQHARLQSGEHGHHRPRHGPPATDPRGAAGRGGGAAGPDSGISGSLQRHRRRLHRGQTGQEDKKRTNGLMMDGWMDRTMIVVCFCFDYFSSSMNITDPLVLR